MSNIFVFIYRLPLYTVTNLTFVSIVMWAIIRKTIFRDKLKIWKIINIILSFVIVLFILIFTLANRNIGNYNVLLYPFHTINDIYNVNPELFRAGLMNVALFVPLGLFMPNIYKKNNLLKGFLFVFIISFLIEFVQFYYKIGQCDVDDIICNLLGYIIGSFSFLL